MKKRFEIRWQGRLVGHLLDPSGEMFELYGVWLPAKSDATQEFLTSVERGDEVVVDIYGGPELGSTTRGFVEIVTDEEISIKIHPETYSE